SYAPERPAEPFDGKIEHRSFALCREIAAESAGNIDETERCAADIGENRSGVVVARFLENQIVAFESQRIAEKLERDAIIAAERQSGEQVATIRADLERARGNDIGRHGDDRGRGRNRAARGSYRHAAPAVDRNRRR